jgi:hypothetical protein
MTMSAWLKRDPMDGLLIGPDGCHYENEHQAAHYGLLHLCGCGSPEDAYNFCRDILACFDRRGCHDTPPAQPWIDAESAVEQLIRQRPAEAAHVISHMLSHLDLLEHGGSVGGSWLTDNGARIVDMDEMTEDLLDPEAGKE